MTERVERIAPNLHRWLTPSPHWREGDDKDTGGWPRDVASLLYEREGTAIVVDPQAGADDTDVWAFLDDRVTHARRVVVALTASWHLRDTAALIEAKEFAGWARPAEPSSSAATPSSVAT